MSTDAAILALNFDHYWPWEGTHDDLAKRTEDRPTNEFSAGAPTFEDVALTINSTKSLFINDRSERVGCADARDMNTTLLQERIMGGWIMLNEVMRSPTSLYKEGGGTNLIAILVGFGNLLCGVIVDRDDFDIQCFGDNVLAPNRPYHVMVRFSGSDSENDFALYVDGVRQAIASPNSTPNKVDMAQHSGNCNWGKPDNNLNLGGSSFAMNGSTGCYYQRWVSYATRIDPAIIRTKLFEPFALASVTITSGTAEAMQAQVDALADTTLPNYPLCIRVERVTGGDLTINANNVKFDPLASIHIQWMGTAGETLTWNNNNGGNASIGSALEGGALSLVTPASLRLSNLKPGSQIYIKNVTDDVDLFVQNEPSSTFIRSVAYTADKQLLIRVRNASGNPKYKPLETSGTLTISGFSLVVNQELDE